VDQGEAPGTPPEQLKAQELEELMDALSEIIPRKNITRRKKEMIGLFWNIRGLGLPRRIPALVSKIRCNHVDFLGLLETKKDSFSDGFLRSLTSNIPFVWHLLPAVGSARGILVGANSEKSTITEGYTLKFSISVFIQEKLSGFSWKLIVIYGSLYEERKQEFIDGLHHIMNSWQGHILLGGDFNLVRKAGDKSNGIINNKWVDAFNDWVSSWGLVELDPNNRLYTWTNNQETPILARIDRIFASTDWDANFPLTRVKALERLPSDHNPLLLDTAVNVNRPKKKFRFEKWWLEKENFKEVVRKAWSQPCR
jgi:hypothetical protein